jgi:uncharacterized linocin/CFP29 family protein
MYRNLAPIDKNVWEQIDERAKEVLVSTLTARKAVHVAGPFGAGHTAYNHGRLGDVTKKEDVAFASYEVTPLVESRIEFKLNRWELDNAIRGDKNIDFTNLEEAVKKSALFEENAIYAGLKEGSIRGLLEVKSEVIKLGNTASEIKKAVAEGVIKLKKAFAHGAMDLIVSEEIYTRFWSVESSYPLLESIEKLIGGKVVSSEVMTGAILIPHDDENLSLILGEDFSLGYQEHDNNEITFYVKESFTFQILDENLVVRFQN